MVTVLGLRLEEISSIIVLDLNYARIEFLSFFLGTEQESSHLRHYIVSFTEVRPTDENMKTV